MGSVQSPTCPGCGKSMQIKSYGEALRYGCECGWHAPFGRTSQDAFENASKRYIVNLAEEEPAPMETLLLEMKYGDKYILGFIDSNNAWHELSPYMSGKNNNELSQDAILSWSYLYNKLGL